VFLFFAIAILEDSGYMARAAYVMDGIMRIFKLQGRSFVPLVLGFGCTVPAILATRTIESDRDRKVTIMVLPLMSCSARLPIYALIIPAFFSIKYQATVMWLIYVIGIAFALIAARLMKSTLFKGDGEVYLMELPPYRMPTLKSLCFHMWDRSKMYLEKAGTVILATSIILYICNTYPKKDPSLFTVDYQAQIEAAQKSGSFTDAEMKLAADLPGMTKEFKKEIKETRTLPEAYLETVDTDKCNAAQKAVIEKSTNMHDSIAKISHARQAEMMTYTISGRVGKLFERIMKYVGFDWRLSTASIAALSAKEVFVSQLGILFSQGEVDENSDSLRELLVKNYTPLQAFCVMLFCLLTIPCIATLAVIRREMNSWIMAAVEAVGFFVLAYVTTFIVFQLGSLLKIGTTLL
jgi:ferrous iron transport protein B